MDISSIINEANPDFIILAFTGLIAFLSWLLKSLVEKPLSESKNTFSKYFDKRIEILTEVKTRLNFIAYFPSGNENLEFKNQLQSILLKDGKAGYLSKEIYDNIIRIAIDPKTDEKFLLDTIQKIDKELYLKISKIQDEISFYRQFSNYNPFKRFFGIALLFLQYIISISIVLTSLFWILVSFFEGSYVVRVLIILFGIMGVFVIDKWLRK